MATNSVSTGRHATKEKEEELINPVAVETEQWCRKLALLNPVTAFPTVYYEDVRNLAVAAAQKGTARGPGLITVIKSDSLEAARGLKNPCVLNMASWQELGGGWKRFATAQEEQLFRRTTYCLHTDTIASRFPLPMYAGFYSPNVLVTRDTSNHHYKWLAPERQFYVSFLAEAAFLIQGERPKDFTDKQTEITRDKINAMFAIARLHDHRNLVLGAFGCGAYHNPPKQVANLFAAALHQHRHYFDMIVFAILDSPGREDNYRVFREAFRSAHLI